MIEFLYFRQPQAPYSKEESLPNRMLISRILLDIRISVYFRLRNRHYCTVIVPVHCNQIIAIQKCPVP